MSKKKKAIWLVEHGEYSDYSVLGIFSTEANAKLFAGKMGKMCRDIEVRESVLDPGIDEMNRGLSIYLVNMNYDGGVTRVERAEHVCEGTVTFYSPPKWPPDQQATLFAYVWAKDDKHAIKIVNEKRTRAIAEGRFTPAGPVNDPST